VLSIQPFPLFLQYKQMLFLAHLAYLTLALESTLAALVPQLSDKPDLAKVIAQRQFNPKAPSRRRAINPAQMSPVYCPDLVNYEVGACNLI